MHLSRSFAILAVGIFTLCSVGFADTFSFGIDPGGADPNPDTELQETFTSGSHTIIVYGFDNMGASPLFFKNNGGDETGIGLANGGSDHEIGSSNFIQITGAGIAFVTIGSVQDGEQWEIYGSNTLGTSEIGVAANLIASGTGGGTANDVPLTGGYAYYTIYSPKGDILLDSAKTGTSRVPEPGTTSMLMTMGLVGLFAFGGRKLGKLSA